MFLAPVKKSKAFVSEIKTKRGKPFLLKLSNVSIQDVFHLKEHQGYLLHIGVSSNTSAHETIRTLDELALQETLQRKAQWFPNSRMSKEKILEYFRPSLAHTSNTLHVLVSDAKEPSHVEWYGQPVDCFDALLQKGKRTLRDATATFVIEAHGLYFYEQKFGIRWILRSVVFQDPPSTEIGEDELYSDKHEIEEFWGSEVAAVHESINQDIEVLKSKIEMLENEKQRLVEMLESAKGVERVDPTWNSGLEHLRMRIAKYRSGML